MVQSVDLGNTSVVNFNNNEVRNLQLNGNTIWKAFEDAKDLIYSITLNNENYKTPTLNFTKQDAQPTSIDWGDGSTETIAASGVQTISHTYTSLGDYNITLSGEGKINLNEGVVGRPFVDSDGYNIAAILKGVVIGTIVDRIEDDAFLNTNMSSLSIHSNITYIGSDNFTKDDTQIVSTTGEYVFDLDTMQYTSLTEFVYIIAEDGIVKYGIKGDLTTMSNYETHLPEGLVLLAGGMMTSSNVTIPSTVKYFAHGCLGGKGYLKFNQPADMQVFLPEAGDGTGMCYSKSAVARDIYTDNEIIKNYNWAGDNVTPTFYHIDGTLWE